MLIHLAHIRNNDAILVSNPPAVVIKLVKWHKRFTRLLLGLAGLSCKVARSAGTFPRDHRRLMGDLIEVYNTMRGVHKVDSLFFPG